jgi:hypothetical protein
MSREDFQNLLVLAQAVPFFDISASFEPNLRAGVGSDAAPKLSRLGTL